MALRRAVGWLAGALLTVSGLGACSTRFADVIVRGDPADVCETHGAAECASDTAHGCSLQPNPLGCLGTDSSCGPGQCRAGDPFVRRSGESLLLHDQPFRFLGAVSWWAAWQEGGCQLGAYANQESALGPSFDELAAMRVSVLRVWAFQSYAGASGTDYSHIDRLVARARAAGVRLLPVLENMHSDCSANPARDDAWFAAGYKSPYGNYALSYRDYVAGLVAHLRDEPTVLGWELMHEAGSSQFAPLDAFAADMSTLVRAIDPNHLIAFGVNDGDNAATSTDGDGSNYFKLNDHSAIDLIDVHDFGSPDEAQPARIARCRAIAHEVGKPIFVGAGAVELSDPSSSAYAQRGGRIRRKIEAAQNDAFSGYLVYDFVPSWPSPYYDFDSRPEEPLAGPSGILAQHAPANPP